MVVVVIVQLIIVIDRRLIKLPLDAASAVSLVVVLANELVVAFEQIGDQQPGHNVAVSLTSSRRQCEKAADSDEQSTSEHTSDETAQFALHHGRVCPDQVRLDQVKEQLLCAQ